MGRAGPLNPPAGAIGSTAKPLGEIEPRTAINATNTPGDSVSLFKITSAGSYYLTTNVFVGVGRVGIEVAATGVTIDLNGFQILGLGATAGVRAASTTSGRVTVRNGRIYSCAVGIDLNDVSDATVEGVEVQNCTGAGVRAGDRARVIGCAAAECDNGIHVGSFGVVSGCSAGECTGRGVIAGNEALVESCNVRGSGVDGVYVGQRSVVRSINSHGNEGDGIVTGANSSVIGCTASANGGLGILVSRGLVESCVANFNGQYGFSPGEGSVVRGCQSRLNGSLGYNLGPDTFVMESAATANGSWGFYNYASAVRLINNVSTGNTTGFRISGTGSFLAGNFARGNTTNWDVAANNHCYVVDAVGAPAFTGNAGGASPGSANPFANFTT